MEYEEALHGQVVETAYKSEDGDELILRMAHGGVVVVEGHSYEDVDLRLQSYTQEEWLERLTCEQRDREARERLRANAPPPDPFWQGVINDMRRDINRQPFLGESMVIPIRSRRSDVSG